MAENDRALAVPGSSSMAPVKYSPPLRIKPNRRQKLFRHDDPFRRSLSRVRVKGEMATAAQQELKDNAIRENRRKNYFATASVFAAR